MALVHLSYNDAQVELNRNDLIELKNKQIVSVLTSKERSQSNSVLTDLLNLSSLVSDITIQSEDSSVKISINQSDSIIYTLLSLLSKRDLINEQTGKYLIQYFQFFSYYSSLGLQQAK